MLKSIDPELMQALAGKLREKTNNSCSIDFEFWAYRDKYRMEDEDVTQFKIWDGFHLHFFKTVEELVYGVEKIINQWEVRNASTSNYETVTKVVS